MAQVLRCLQQRPCQLQRQQEVKTRKRQRVTHLREPLLGRPKNNCRTCWRTAGSSIDEPELKGEEEDDLKIKDLDFSKPGKVKVKLTFGEDADDLDIELNSRLFFELVKNFSVQRIKLYQTQLQIAAEERESNELIAAMKGAGMGWQDIAELLFELTEPYLLWGLLIVVLWYAWGNVS